MNELLYKRIQDIVEGHEKSVPVQKIIDALNDADIDEKRVIDSNAFPLHELVLPAIKAKVRQARREILIKTGLPNLDELIGGFQFDELVILGGRPGMGKTVLLISLAIEISAQLPVLFWTLELDKTNLALRIACGFNCDYIDFSSTSNAQIYQCHEMAEQRHFFINDDRFSSIDLFFSFCLNAIKQHDIQVVFIDYMQLLELDNKKLATESAISHVIKELKQFAQTNNILIIVSSQMSRAAENRTGYEGKIPLMSDLQESAVIEDVADKVLLLHRPEYYRYTEDENGNSLVDVAELFIVKNNNGVLGTARLIKGKGFCRFF